jgi:hypothetical protein
VFLISVFYFFLYSTIPPIVSMETLHFTLNLYVFVLLGEFLSEPHLLTCGFVVLTLPNILNLPVFKNKTHTSALRKKTLSFSLGMLAVGSGAPLRPCRLAFQVLLVTNLPLFHNPCCPSQELVTKLETLDSYPVPLLGFHM